MSHELTAISVGRAKGRLRADTCALMLLMALRTRGLRVRLVDGQPVVGPRSEVSKADLVLLARYREAVVARLEEEEG